MRHRLAFAAVLAGVALAVTACGGTTTTSTPTSTSSSAASNDELVAWVDKVCGASLTAIKALSTQPQLDPSDPAKLKAGFSEWLAAGSAGIDTSIKELEGLKNGPHKDSEKLVAAGTEVFGKLKTALDNAKKGVDAADPSDPQAFAEAFTKVGTELSSMGKVADEFDKSFESPELIDARKKAKSCQEVEGGSASTSTSASK